MAAASDVGSSAPGKASAPHSNGNSSNGKSTNSNSADDASNSSGSAALDVSKFPKSPAEVSCFLAEIDGPCKPPPTSSEGEAVPVSVSSAMTYRATSVRVGAGSLKEIPFPLPDARVGTEVAWDVSVEGRDIDFAVGYRFNSSEEPNLLEDYITIEPLKPSTSASSEGSYQLTSSSPLLSPSSSSPVSFLLLFDNTFSWITPKQISYTVTISPPVDEHQISRSRRAQAALQTLSSTLLPQAQANFQSKTEHRQQTEAQATKLKQALSTLQKNIQTKQATQQSLQTKKQTLQSSSEQSQQAMETLNDQLQEELRQMQQLEKTMQELQVEKQIRQEKINELSLEATARAEDLQTRQAEMEELEVQVEDVKKDLQRVKEEEEQGLLKDMEGVEKKREEALKEEGKFKETVEVLKGLEKELRPRVLA